MPPARMSVSSLCLFTLAVPIHRFLLFFSRIEQVTRQLFFTPLNLLSSPCPVICLRCALRARPPKPLFNLSRAPSTRLHSESNPFILRDTKIPSRQDGIDIYIRDGYAFVNSTISNR